MPINFNVLPDKISIPVAPNHIRWLLFVGVFTTAAFAILFILWPSPDSKFSIVFWFGSLLLPFIIGVFFYSARWAYYQTRLTYFDTWNNAYQKEYHKLVIQGQRPIALIDSCYYSPAGSNRLSEAILNGVIPLQPVYLPFEKTTINLSQLQPVATEYTQDEYKSRLAQSLKKIAPSLKEILNKLPKADLTLRIKHDGIINDNDILNICATELGYNSTTKVIFSQNDDGLLWLDSWLDGLSSYQIVISLEIHLYLRPLSQHAETVSAVIFGLPEWCAKHKINPQALVHRPVQITDQPESLHNALCWGKLLEKPSSCFFWHSQIANSKVTDTILALYSEIEYSPNQNNKHNLDGSLGLPDIAVGNMLLIISSEKAKLDNQNQFILLQDKTIQGCVVRPLLNY